MHAQIVLETPEVLPHLDKKKNTNKKMMRTKPIILLMGWLKIDGSDW